MRPKGTKNKIISDKDIQTISLIQLQKAVEVIAKVAKESELSIENLQLVKSILDSFNKFKIELDRKEEHKKQKLENSVKKFVSFRNELLMP